MKIKSVFISLKILLTFVLLRTLGSIIHDISRKYDNITITQLRKYEKFKDKVNKIQLDITFLENCRAFQVTPKFIVHSVHSVNKYDINSVQTHVLKAEIRRRHKRKLKLECEYIYIYIYIIKCK